MFLSLLCSICIAFEMGGEMIPLACGGLMSDGLPVATVGYVPTIFVCWGVGLVCRVLCPMALCVLSICAWLSRFISCLFVTSTIIFSSGESCLLFIVIVCFSWTLSAVGYCRYRV